MTSTVNVLPHLQELRQQWRNQNFSFTKEQQEAYNILIEARREQVKEYYAEGRVSKGRSKNDDV
jgi:argininosuccinate lyase